MTQEQRALRAKILPSSEHTMARYVCAHTLADFPRLPLRNKPEFRRVPKDRHVSLASSIIFSAARHVTPDKFSPLKPASLVCGGWPVYCHISLRGVSWKGGGSDESGSFIVRGVAGDRYDFTRSGTNPRTARGAAVGGGWIQFSRRARGFENSPQHVALDRLSG